MGKFSSNQSRATKEYDTPIILFKSVKEGENKRGEATVTVYLDPGEAAKIQESLNICTGDNTVKLMLNIAEREARNGDTFKSGYMFVRDAVPFDGKGQSKKPSSFKAKTFGASKASPTKAGKGKVLKSKKRQDEESEEE